MMAAAVQERLTLQYYDVSRRSLCIHASCASCEKKGKQRRLGISNLIKKLKQEQDSIKKNERRFLKSLKISACRKQTGV